MNVIMNFRSSKPDAYQEDGPGLTAGLGVARDIRCLRHSRFTYSPYADSPDGTTGPRTDALSTWIEDTYGDNYPDVTDDAGLIDETVAEILAFGVNHKSKNLVNENDGMTKAFEKKFGQLKKDKGKPKKRTEAYTGQELSNWAMAPTYTMDGEPVHGTTFDLKKGISRLNAEATHGRYVQGNRKSDLL